MSRIKAFKSGFDELFASFRFFSINKRLWWLAAIPTVISVALLIVSLIIMFNYYGDIFQRVIEFLGLAETKIATGWFAAIWGYVVVSLKWIIKILLFVLLAILILLAFYFISQIIVSPFNDLLSEKTEEIITGIPAPPFKFRAFILNLIRTIQAETIKALIFISIPLILLALNFIPVVGSIIYAILTFVFGAWALGFAYVDYPMGRKLWKIKERISFVRKNYLACIGLGVVFIIPFFAFIFTAPMTIAGTSLFLKLREEPS